jgi:hypothetical protein
VFRQFFSFIKYYLQEVQNTNSFLVRWQKMALLVLPKGRLVWRAKPNVPFVRLAKRNFKKCEGVAFSFFCHLSQ